MFVDLFYEDENALENELSLFNALFGTNYNAEDIEIKKIRVENTLYMNLRNDVSFNVGNKILVFSEHQSTINGNMPLRNLMYVGRAYEQLVPIEKRYKKKTVKIPIPEFFVFYNGKEEIGKEKIMKLSDAYIFDSDIDITEDNPLSLELTVKVININSDAGNEILTQCKILNEYAQFVEAVREFKAKGDEDYMKQAIEYCIENHILEEYLRRKGSDVMGFLCAEYDYEMDMKVQGEEKYQEGVEYGLEQGKTRTLIEMICKKIQKGKSLEEIIEDLEVDTENIRPIYEAAMQCAPEYDLNKIYSMLQK